jgi:hypothetical protein
MTFSMPNIKSGLDTQPKSYLFRTALGRTAQPSDRPLSQADVYRMIGRRAEAAGVLTKLDAIASGPPGSPSICVTVANSKAPRQMPNHESARTTGLYDRRNDQVSLDEVERILN